MKYKLYLVIINSESNEFLKKILVEELSKGYSNIFFLILVFFSKFQSYQWTIRLTDIFDSSVYCPNIYIKLTFNIYTHTYT